jgi:carbamoyltransferase
MNSVANGKIRRVTPYRRVYIQSAAGDAGGAIGAALQVWSELSDQCAARSVAAPAVLEGDRVQGRAIMDHAYLGPAFSGEEIAALIEQRAPEIQDEGCRFERIADETQLCCRAADAVASGNVVGWFQGRMEWGPRALGNRSIVCDPRRSDMKTVLNSKIKRRESFRPFAPSVLKEHVLEWFEEDGDVPFMMQVYQIRQEKRALIPAVTHVDGSGRLQTVYKQTNPLFWHLIDAFCEITGVPMVLNTSFNENEPVVCRPEEALDCFLRTKMDVLVLGRWFIERHSA